MVWFYRLIWFCSCIRMHTLSIPLWSDFITLVYNVLHLRSTFFQSHYGLILSLFKHIYGIWKEISFNPTMVWFYPAVKRLVYRSKIKLSIPLWSDFIYKLWLISITIWRAFNPTMVWFYHQQAVHTELDSISFQSHYGLILSQTYCPIAPPQPQLSIPLWSDFI